MKKGIFVSPLTMVAECCRKRRELNLMITEQPDMRGILLGHISPAILSSKVVFTLREFYSNLRYNIILLKIIKYEAGT
jgi:hypothetical protein